MSKQNPMEDDIREEERQQGQGTATAELSGSEGEEQGEGESMGDRMRGWREKVEESETWQMIKESPGISLAVAASLGFLLGMCLRRED